jgi:hypothetical protein
LNFVLSSSSVSSISSASNSLPCNQNKTAEQTASYPFSIFCTSFPALRTHKCQKTYLYICKPTDCITSQIVYMSKIFHLPTDAQLNYLKNNFKIYIKTSPTCFGVITIIRELHMQPHYQINNTDMF